MKSASVVLCAVLCSALVGCSSPMASMNKRMAYADSGAVLAAAVAIDQIPQDKFDAAKGAIVTMCDDLSKFLDDGKIADLPLDKARQAVEAYMIKKGWQQYTSLVDVIFAWVSVQKVPVDKIGPDNVMVIKQGLAGVARQAARAKKEWAQPIGSARVDTTRGKSLKVQK